jgi:putative metal-binding protein
MRRALTGLAGTIAVLLSHSGCVGGSAEVVCVGSVGSQGCGDAGGAASGGGGGGGVVDGATAACGNGVIDPGERCDTSIGSGPGACPTVCDDGVACTDDLLLAAGTCAASCSFAAVAACLDDDGCCPAGCNSATDGDCAPACGDGALDAGEACDTAIPPGEGGACPSVCDDGDACTDDVLLSAGTCAASCSFTPLTVCAGRDGCCPPGCSYATDPDCAPPVEVCNGVDDDGDTLVDEGCDDDGDGFCDAAMTVVGTPPACPFGGGDCDDDIAAIHPGAAETCDNRDENCDGRIDDGNPGGGATCEPAPEGGCTAVKTCVAGMLVCRGGFVSPMGLPDNPGTKAEPVSSIRTAIANAVAGGAGGDVCVCDPSTAGDTNYEEDVTMVEGTSVIGGYDCDTWTRGSGTTTRIRSTTAEGVKFPAGLTASTALDGFTVESLAVDGGASTAITVSDSSPSLVGVNVDWPSGAVPSTGIGLRIMATPGSVAAPTVSGGTISGPPQATEASIGVDCDGCAGTTLAADSVRFGDAQTSVGIWGRGSLQGVTISASPASLDWGIEGPWAEADAVGVLLDGCTGAPAVGAGTGLAIRAGIDPATGVGVKVTGPSCAAVIQGDGATGEIVGCSPELGGGTCVGISCEDGAPCEIRDNVLVAGASWIATTAGTATALAGVRCRDGSCAAIERNRIYAGDRGVSESAYGLDLDGSSPRVDANHIEGAAGAACPAEFCAAARLDRSTAKLTNNVIQQGGGPGAGVEVSGSLGGPGPILDSNTILMACPSIGTGIGVRIVAGTGAGPLPVVESNIIALPAAPCSGVLGVLETGAAADPLLFAYNDLWNAPDGLYVDEGTETLTSIGAVNGLPEAGQNLWCDPAMDPTGHIAVASCCVDAGTPERAPTTDFDGQPRPFGGGYDIGSDENE